MNRLMNSSSCHRNIRNLIIIILVMAILIVTGFFIYNANKTYPLGDGLEYVGATYSGTIPFLGDSNPSASYHYATDMTPEDVVRYFKKAVVDDSGDLMSKDNTSQPITFSLRAPTSNNPIYIYYYVDATARINEFKLRPSSKKHLIIIENEDYESAKNSL